MLTDELLGTDNNAGLAAVSLMEAYSFRSVDNISDVMEVNSDEDLIKGLCFITNALACSIVGSNDPTALYDRLKETIPEYDQQLMSRVTALLYASQEETAAKFFVLLFNDPNKEQTMTLFCFMNEILSASPILPEGIWPLLREVILKDYMLKKDRQK
jgi:hypothetical protein